MGNAGYDVQLECTGSNQSKFVMILQVLTIEWTIKRVDETPCKKNVTLLCTTEQCRLNPTVIFIALTQVQWRHRSGSRMSRDITNV